MTKLSPRSEALAFRIWAYCQGVEWNTTSREIANLLDVHTVTVSNIIRFKKWSARLRASEFHAERESLAYYMGGTKARDTRLIGNNLGERTLYDVLRICGVPSHEARPE